jgi:hypothetical protein
MKRSVLVLALALIVTPLFAQTAREKITHRSERVWTDATRLAGLLRDVQVEVNVSESMWRTIVNEANTLANRIYANTSRSAAARSLARDLRTHVGEMRAGALRGDAAGARKHANEASAFAYRLIDWAE